MNKLVRTAIVFAAAISAQLTSGATTLAGSNTFVGLVWNLSGPAAIGCSQILADATGDASRSKTIVIYGAMNCPSLGGGVPMIGSAYVGTDGRFNFSFNFGLVLVVCPNLVGASGACTAFNSSGANLGPLAISLAP